jgi:hypothetical protein|tara:strand:+ start:462 stop:776 length:315 start_codon:yes stop_codon:yes gene_type:complete
MIVKRNNFNKYLIQEFMNDKLNGYTSEFNGKWVFSLDHEYKNGPKVAYIKTDMGHETIYLRDEDDVDYACQRIKETLIILDDIYESEKRIDEYCVENPWTRHGT